MPTLRLNIKTAKRTAPFLSVNDIKTKYLFGVDIKKDGNPLPDSVYEYWVDIATQQIQNYLTIKLFPEIVTENKDFHYDDWIHWGMVRTSWLITQPIYLWGYIGAIKQVNYPKEWLSARKTTDQLYSRMLYVVPNSTSTYNQAAQIYTGILPNIGWMGGSRQTPNYWTISYLTGFLKLPLDILNAIGMLASIYILTVGNETLASAMGGLGTSSKSISLDGLSQSVSMYVNGQTGIFGARIKQYSDMLFGPGGEEGLLKRLQDQYGAFIWAVG